MSKLTKKFLSILLSVLMLFSIVSTMNAFAADIVRSGKCGDNVYYKLYSDGTLIISGEGAMIDNRKGQSGVSYGSPFPLGQTIKSVIIEDGVTHIGGAAFQKCYNIESITIPDSVTSIGTGAFLNCSSLTSITLPDGLTIIPWDAFYYCTNLTSIIIPDSVTSIIACAFDGCQNLKDVYYTGTQNQWNNINIDNYLDKNHYLLNATIYYNGGVHSHSYTSEVTKTATCAEEGVITYTCTCGDSYTETISATGHSYTSEVTKTATCTEEGVITYTCTCGDSYNETISATGHSDDDKDGKCNVCGADLGTQKPDEPTKKGLFDLIRIFFEFFKIILYWFKNLF